VLKIDSKTFYYVRLIFGAQCLMAAAPLSMVRLPKTNPSRSAPTFLKLIARIDVRAESAMGWQGEFLRPGAMITEKQLRPDDRYPWPPLLVESAGRLDPKAPKAERRSTWILWTYDPERKAFREIARANSFDWGWSMDLQPIALAHLRAHSESRNDCMADRQARVAAAVDKELRDLDRAGALGLLSALHSVLGTRLTAAMGGDAGVPFSFLESDRQAGRPA
jgi:hypothetical protein